MSKLEKGDLVLIDMPVRPKRYRIAKVTGLPSETLVRVRHWLPDEHRFSQGEVTYHVDWLKDTR